MTNITFCTTGHFYESYRDFWRLVELSNFPIIPVSELDISQEGVFITAPMNEDWREHINEQHKQGKRVNAHLVLWNIERPGGSAGGVGNYAEQCRYLVYGLWPNGEKTKQRAAGEIVESYGRFIDEVWVADRRLAEETHLRFVVLGSDTGLGEPGSEKRYDFCHMSYELPHRAAIYNKFSAESIGPNSWPPERDEVLKQSRFGLNIHQEDRHTPFQEPLRLALYAAYGLPIITETIFDPYPWSDETAIFCSYDSIVRRLKQVLDEDYEPYKQMGLRARETMTGEFQFGKCVRLAVSQSLDSWR